MTSLDVNDVDSERTIRAAIDSGINFLDTAFAYGRKGESERLIARSIVGQRDKVVIASKGGSHWDDTGKHQNDGRPERLKFECEESLKRLRIDTIDLLYLHAPDPKVPVVDSATAYADLIAAGKNQSRWRFKFVIARDDRISQRV